MNKSRKKSVKKINSDRKIFLNKKAAIEILWYKDGTKKNRWRKPENYFIKRKCVKNYKKKLKNNEIDFWFHPWSLFISYVMMARAEERIHQPVNQI